MKLLVTGGSGFIGANFINYWFEKYPNSHITNLDKLTYAGNQSNTEQFKDRSNYKFIEGDICDVDLVEKLMNGIDIIVHFAAESHVDRSIKNPKLFLETNIIGTQVLLDAAKKFNVKRFHHVSTDEVFGEIELDSTNKFTESTNYSPRSPYAASKAASDHLVRAYFHTYNLPITMSNCSNNYGPYQSPEKFIPRAITNLLLDEPIKVYGKGENVRDWLYVEDHCSAIDLIINKGKVGETYLVGGMNKDVINLELAKLLIEIVGKDESYIEFVTDRPGHDKKYSVDWSKIKNELGWIPKHSFEEGLRVTVEWYKDNPNYWENTKKEAEEFYKN